GGADVLREREEDVVPAQGLHRVHRRLGEDRVAVDECDALRGEVLLLQPARRRDVDEEVRVATERSNLRPGTAVVASAAVPVEPAGGKLRLEPPERGRKTRRVAAAVLDEGFS